MTEHSQSCNHKKQPSVCKTTTWIESPVQFTQCVFFLLVQSPEDLSSGGGAYEHHLWHHQWLKNKSWSNIQPTVWDFWCPTNNYVQKLPFSGSNLTFCMQRRCWTHVRCFSVRIDTHEDLLTVSCPSHRRAVPRHITELPSLLTTYKQDGFLIKSFWLRGGWWWWEARRKETRRDKNPVIPDPRVNTSLAWIIWKQHTQRDFPNWPRFRWLMNLNSHFSLCVCFLILKLRIRMPLRAADIKRSVCVCKYTCSPCSYSQQSVVSRH